MRVEWLVFAPIPEGYEDTYVPIPPAKYSGELVGTVRSFSRGTLAVVAMDDGSFQQIELDRIRHTGVTK
jgi:hypothetical protein